MKHSAEQVPGFEELVGECGWTVGQDAMALWRMRDIRKCVERVEVG